MTSSRRPGTRLRRGLHAVAGIALGAIACSAPDQEAALVFGAGEAAAVSVPGIPGPYCAYGAEKHLLELPVVARVELDWDRERIVVFPVADRSLDADDLRRAMERADYPYRYRIETAGE